jgi:hypothetical protein
VALYGDPDQSDAVAPLGEDRRLAVHAASAWNVLEG